MQDFNIHTHTTRCNHAIGKDEEYVLAAIKNGIKHLGFSDHVPYTDSYSDHDRMRYDELEDYIESIQFLKEKYKNQITIYLGFECEYYPNKNAYYSELLERVDYLILGQHYPNIDGIDFCISATDEEIEKYAELVCAGIESGYFSYVAHLEYFMLARNSWNKQCTEVIDTICKTAKKYNTPIEINLKGLSYGLHDFSDGTSYFYPNKNALPIYQKYDNRFVYGLDCHDPELFSKMNQYINEFNETFPNNNLCFIENIHDLKNFN
ncbi:histidinol-phosphatase [Anaerorhabdus sp.]|jgi:histidinol-phosphatase (PHP family)|uniref:histidinol-phosphatase n=1 Tax=Anaerorhabdus sp. TaxID=1872524 RepID=UPI002FC8EC26